MPFLSGYNKRKPIKYGTVIPASDLTDFPKLFNIAADSDIAAELTSVIGPSGTRKYKEILYGTTFPGSNLTDFPKLIDITDPEIATECVSGGGIDFTDADGNQIPFGLYPETDLASGRILARVKTDLLTAASTGDVMMRVYYGKDGTTSEDKAGTVSNGYVLFMPMEEDPSGSAPQMFDWVTETNVGTSHGTMTGGDLVAGKVGNAIDFDGSDDRISFSAVTFDITTTSTVELHLKPNGQSATYGNVFGVNGSGVGVFYKGSGAGADASKMSHYTNADHHSTNPLTDGVWNAVAISLDSGVGTHYLNGATNGTYSGGTSQSIDTIGSDSSNEAYKGVLDEVRASSVARSTDWLAYAYEDDFNNADTFTLGEETCVAGIAVTLDDGTTEVPIGVYPTSEPTTGDLILRAKFSLDSAAVTGDVLGYLYYDQTQQMTSDRVDVVSNNYHLFVPLEQIPNVTGPQMMDWVSGTYKGTSAGSMTSGDLVAANVGDGIDCDGSDDRIKFFGGGAPSTLLNSGVLTVELLVKASSYGAYNEPFWSSGRHCTVFVDDTTSNWYYGLCGSEGALGTGSAMSTGVWQSLAIRANGTSTSTGTVFHNGSVRDSGLSVGSSTDFSGGGVDLPFEIGTVNGPGSSNFTGQIDEFRFSWVARSDDWLAYAYQDDFNNGDTFTLGAEETAGGGSSISRTASDSPSTSDSVSRTLVLNRTASDSPSTSDSASRTLSLPRTLSDSPSVSDAITRLLVASRTLSDSPSTTDEVTGIKGRVVTVADAPSTTDSIVRTLSSVRTTTDASSTTDSLSRLFVGFRTLSDNPAVSSVVTVSSSAIQPPTIFLASNVQRNAMLDAFVQRNIGLNQEAGN